MKTESPNPALSRDLAKILSAAERLHTFEQRLTALGTVLPSYMYVKPLDAEIVFHKSALRKLNAEFGKDGWEREPNKDNGFTHNDWCVVTFEGVKLRIFKAEDVSHPTTKVSPAELEHALQS